MFDRVQEVRVFERLQDPCPNCRDLLLVLSKILHKSVQPARIDAGHRLVALQCRKLEVQFLVYLATNIAAGENSENFKQRGNSRARTPVGFLIVVVQHLLIQEFEAQECAHAFTERLLIR